MTSAERDRNVARAHALHDEARGLYERGEYRRALERLYEAVALDPEGNELVYNIALIHERLGEIELAERHYRASLEGETDPQVRARIEAVLRRMEGAKKDFARPEATEAQPSAPPEPPALASRESTRAEPSSRPSPWMIATGGVSGAALLVGNVLAATALARQPGPSAATGGGVTVQDLADDAASAHRVAVAADVAFVVATLAGAATLILALTTRGRPPDSDVARRLPATRMRMDRARRSSMAKALHGPFHAQRTCPAPVPGAARVITVSAELALLPMEPGGSAP